MKRNLFQMPSQEWTVVEPLFSGPVASEPRNFVTVCPADKSITHRSIIFAAMAKGNSRVYCPLLGEDCLSTIVIFRQLGVAIDIVKDPVAKVNMLKISSPGWSDWQQPVESLDFGNSGTTARLLIGVFAATPGLTFECQGDASLQQRPMNRVVKPLRDMGADISGVDDGNFLPITIRGKQLEPKSHRFDKASAQVKSSICLAGLNTSGETSIELPSGSRDHTEKFLARLGAHFRVIQATGVEKVIVYGPFRPEADDLRVPGDPSSSAFFGVLAAIADQGTFTLDAVLNNETRTGFLTFFDRAGVSYQFETIADQADYIEPVAKLVIQSGAPLLPVLLEPDIIPSMIDEIPVLAVLAAFATGESVFQGLGELRVKESNRLEKTAELLSLAGVQCAVEGDNLRIMGGGLNIIDSFSFDPEGDHRLAMAAAVMACRAKKACTIKGVECADVSFPGFFDLLASVR